MHLNIFWILDIFLSHNDDVAEDSKTAFVFYGVTSHFTLAGLEFFSLWRSGKSMSILLHKTILLLCSLRDHQSHCSLAGFWFVALHVQSQVVRTREAALTDVTLERLRSSMFPDVPGQFVGARKPPLAGHDVTAVRLLPSVDPLMGLKVG